MILLWQWRLIWAIIITIGLGLILAGYVFTSILLTGYATQVRADTLGGCTEPGTQKPITRGGGSRAEKIANAQLIDQAARQAGLSGYASRIGIITAVGESNLINLNYGDAAGPDSRGLFQQRSSWGTLEQRMNPIYAATSFFLGPRQDRTGGLVSVPSWETDPWISNVIHKVQANSNPDYYTKWIPYADQIIQQASIDITRPATTPNEAGAVNPASRGCTDGKGGVNIGQLTGAWTSPLPGAVLTSGYGPRAWDGYANFHYGLDLSTPGRAGQVLAITDMKIITASDISSGGSGTWARGQSLDNALTISMYHMQTGSLKVKVGDTIAAGSPIGTEGATGNVTGRHLHIEFYKGAIPDPWPQTAPITDPCPIFKEKIGFSCQPGAIAQPRDTGTTILTAGQLPAATLPRRR